MDLDLLKEILIVGIGASIFSTATIQKIKEMLKSKKWLYFIAIIISFGIGVAFTLSFSDLDWINALWVGLCTWVGADALYKTFEEKIFQPFSDMNKPSDDKDEIIIDRDGEK
jgi:predicted histidine transporter YuiF (NhaC family)